MNIEFIRDFNTEEVRSLLEATPGIVVQDDIANHVYPMPVFAHDKDEVFVGRIRRDESQENLLKFVDSLGQPKRVATNTVQIAEYLIAHKIL